MFPVEVGRDELVSPHRENATCTDRGQGDGTGECSHRRAYDHTNIMMKSPGYTFPNPKPTILPTPDQNERVQYCIFTCGGGGGGVPAAEAGNANSSFARPVPFPLTLSPPLPSSEQLLQPPRGADELLPPKIAQQPANHGRRRRLLRHALGGLCCHCHCNPKLPRTAAPLKRQLGVENRSSGRHRGCQGLRARGRSWSRRFGRRG